MDTTNIIATLVCLCLGVIGAYIKGWQAGKSQTIEKLYADDKIDKSTYLKYK